MRCSSAGVSIPEYTRTLPAHPPIYLEQGDRGAVEETEQEQDDEGGGHGVQVLKTLLLSAHLPLCRGHNTGLRLCLHWAAHPSAAALGPLLCCPQEGQVGRVAGQKQRAGGRGL